VVQWYSGTVVQWQAYMPVEQRRYFSEAKVVNAL